MKFRNTLRNKYNKIRDTFADCYTSNLFLSLSLFEFLDTVNYVNEWYSV